MQAANAMWNATGATSLIVFEYLVKGAAPVWPLCSSCEWAGLLTPNDAEIPKAAVVDKSVGGWLASWVP
jgi:hypothetical protein